MDGIKNTEKPSEDILKPDDHKKGIEKPKKSHKLRWTLIILLFIFVVIPILLIGYTGIFSIPILTDIFGSKNPIDLGVEVSAEALKSGVDKIPYTLDELPVPATTLPFETNRVFTGSVPVTNDITSEELTSLVDYRLQNVAGIESVQVKFHEGGAELSLQLKEYIDAPIYIKSDITTLPDGRLAFDISSVKIGRMPIPGKYLNDIEEAATELVNDQMAEVNGFSIEKLEFKDNFVDFVGTYPATIELAN